MQKIYYMALTIPRKNSRQWRTAIFLINGGEKWIDDAGEGHMEFIDDISRLREKGWPIEVRDNEDGFSKSYRINRDEWNVIKDSLKKFW